MKRKYLFLGAAVAFLSSGGWEIYATQHATQHSFHVAAILLLAGVMCLFIYILAGDTNTKL